jgi:hypothetical protein
MNAYIDALQVTIERAALRHDRRRTRSASRRPALRLATASVAMAGVAVLIVAAVLQAGKPDPAKAASLPVFSRAATDIADRARELPPRVSHGFDLRRARAFATSKGAGYVVPSSDGHSVCMIIPDPPAG